MAVAAAAATARFCGGGGGNSSRYLLANGQSAKMKLGLNDHVLLTLTHRQPGGILKTKTKTSQQREREREREKVKNKETLFYFH